MPASKAAKITFVVTRSFGTLNEGDRFEWDKDDEWAKRHVKAGLLREERRGEGEDSARQG